jgi:hypothetical protein
MKQRVLQISCSQFDRNNTLVTNKTTSFPLLLTILRGCLYRNSSSLQLFVDLVETDEEPEINKDFGALMYIVTVLLLYSCGIFFMIMKNLKREKHEVDEERTLDDFFRGIPVSEKEREQINVHRIAIQAFNTLTSSKSQEISGIDEFDYYHQNKSYNANVQSYGVDTIEEDEDEEYESNDFMYEDNDIDSDKESDAETSDNIELTH